MKFGYTILYVKDVEETLAFYVKAFGQQIRFFHESKGYGELETGGTALAFAAEDLIEGFGIGFQKNSKAMAAAGFEVAFVTDDVPQAYERAIASGAESINPPTEKPWGQVVCHVRDMNGILVEICTPISG